MVNVAVFVRGHAVQLPESAGKMLAVVKAGLHGNVYNGKARGVQQIGGVVAADRLYVFHHAAIELCGK